MDKFFGVLLVIIFLLIVTKPLLQRWVGPLFQRWAMGKMEDNIRRMAGMPTRREERKARRRAEKRRQTGAENFRRAAGGSRRRQAGEYGRTVSPEAGFSLQEYAEDVEFTEIKSFSHEVNIGVSKENGKEKVQVEEQIEDADYYEIKN